MGLTRSDLYALIDSLVTTNGNREISAARMRTVLKALTDNQLNLEDDSTDIPFDFVAKFPTIVGQDVYSGLSGLAGKATIDALFYGERLMEEDTYTWVAGEPEVQFNFEVVDVVTVKIIAR